MALYFALRSAFKPNPVLRARNFDFHRVLNQKYSSSIFVKTRQDEFNSRRNERFLLDKSVNSRGSIRSGHGGSGNHHVLWVMEKLISVSLAVIIPVALIMPNPVLDYVFVTTIVVHQHWGLESILIDYIRWVIFGHFIPKLVRSMLYIGTIYTLGMLFYFNYNDESFPGAIAKFWFIQGVSWDDAVAYWTGKPARKEDAFELEKPLITVAKPPVLPPPVPVEPPPPQPPTEK